MGRAWMLPPFAAYQLARGAALRARIFDGVRDGKTIKIIAYEAGVSWQCVQSHVRALCSEWGIPQKRWDRLDMLRGAMEYASWG